MLKRCSAQRLLSVVFWCDLPGLKAIRIVDKHDREIDQNNNICKDKRTNHSFCSGRPFDVELASCNFR